MRREMKKKSERKGGRTGWKVTEQGRSERK